MKKDKKKSSKVDLAEKLRKKGKWFKPNVEEIKKKMVSLASKRGKLWKPKDGKNTIRILPSASKKGLWFYEATFHYGVNLPCLKMIGEKCPVCRHKDKLLQSSSDDKLELANELEGKTRILFNIVDLTDEDTKELGVQVWGHSETTLQKLMYIWNDPEWGDFTDPEEGYDIIVEKTDQRGPDAYKIRPRRNPSKIEKMKWLKKMKKLHKVLTPPTRIDAKRRLAEYLQGGGDSKFGGKARSVKNKYGR